MCCITYSLSLHYGLLVGNFVHRRVVGDGRSGEWAPQPSEHYQLMILVRLLVSGREPDGKGESHCTHVCLSLVPNICYKNKQEEGWKGLH